MPHITLKCDMQTFSRPCGGESMAFDGPDFANGKPKTFFVLLSICPCAPESGLQIGVLEEHDCYAACLGRAAGR
jgi:hypothetical protein